MTDQPVDWRITTGAKLYRYAKDRRGSNNSCVTAMCCHAGGRSASGGKGGAGHIPKKPELNFSQK